MQHDGEMPKNYKEKTAFKDIIRQGILKNEHGVPEMEENFDEAIKAVNVSLTKTRIPSQVQDILNDPACTGLTSEVGPQIRSLC